MPEAPTTAAAKVGEALQKRMQELGITTIRGHRLDGKKWKRGSLYGRDQHTTVNHVVQLKDGDLVLKHKTDRYSRYGGGSGYSYALFRGDWQSRSLSDVANWNNGIAMEFLESAPIFFEQLETVVRARRLIDELVERMEQIGVTSIGSPYGWSPVRTSAIDLYQTIEISSDGQRRLLVGWGSKVDIAQNCEAASKFVLNYRHYEKAIARKEREVARRIGRTNRILGRMGIGIGA